MTPALLILNVLAPTQLTFVSGAIAGQCPPVSPASKFLSNSSSYYNSGLFACVEQRADGGACDRNEACTSNLCVSSTCATAKADGTACPLAHNDECTNICAY